MDFGVFVRVFIVFSQPTPMDVRYLRQHMFCFVVVANLCLVGLMMLRWSVVYLQVVASNLAGFRKHVRRNVWR